jgi:hypothetical protein
MAKQTRKYGAKNHKRTKKNKKIQRTKKLIGGEGSGVNNTYVAKHPDSNNSSTTHSPHIYKKVKRTPATTESIYSSMHNPVYSEYATVGSISESEQHEQSVQSNIKEINETYYNNLKELMQLIFDMYKQHFTHITKAELPKDKIELPNTDNENYNYYKFYNTLYKNNKQLENINKDYIKLKKFENFIIKNIINKYFTTNKNNPLVYKKYYKAITSHHKKQIIALKEYANCIISFNMTMERTKKRNIKAHNKKNAEKKEVKAFINFQKCIFEKQANLKQLVYPDTNNNSSSPFKSVVKKNPLYNGSNSHTENLGPLTTTLGYLRSSGPSQTIRNATIISQDFDTIEFIIKDIKGENIKNTKGENIEFKYNVKKFNFEKYLQPTVKIESDPDQYSYFKFSVNDEEIYKQKYIFNVDVKITLIDNLQKNIDEILKFNEETYYDK